MQNDLLKEALGKVTRPARRRKLAVKVVAMKVASIGLACRAFDVGETCDRYSPNLAAAFAQLGRIGGGESSRRRGAHPLSVFLSGNTGAVQTIRVDNGPEYVSGTLMEWAENRGIALTYIQPEKPPRNAHAERD